MTYRLTKTWPDARKQKIATWTCDLMNAVGPTAALIGCSREAVIAQAALETGWGASVVGKHNLFGIKANKAWKGARVTVRTREVINGRSMMIDDVFRDYPSYAESVADHFAFLKKNSRYSRVFDPNDRMSDEQYFDELAKAGYATDPHYAQSLRNMLVSVKMFTDHMVDDAVAASPPVSPPEGFVETASGNIILADIKTSGIVKNSNVGQVITATAGTAVTAATGIQAVRGLFDGISVSDIGAIVLGVVAIAAMTFAFFYFRSIKHKRVDMHEKGIA